MKARPGRMTRVVELPARGQITLPTDFRRKLGLNEGDLVQMTLFEGKIVIEPVSRNRENLREYTEAEIAEFLEADKIDQKTVDAVRRLLDAGAL